MRGLPQDKARSKVRRIQIETLIPLNQPPPERPTVLPLERSKGLLAVRLRGHTVLLRAQRSAQRKVLQLVVLAGLQKARRRKAQRKRMTRDIR